MKSLCNVHIVSQKLCTAAVQLVIKCFIVITIFCLKFCCGLFPGVPWRAAASFQQDSAVLQRDVCPGVLDFALHNILSTVHEGWDRAGCRDTCTTSLLYLPAHTAALTTLVNVPTDERSAFVSGRKLECICVLSRPARLIGPRLQERCRFLFYFIYFFTFTCVLYGLLMQKSAQLFFLLIIQYCNIFNIK